MNDYRRLIASAVTALMTILLVPLGLNAHAQIQPPSQLQGQTINGAGATFPFPLIDTWRVEYKKVNPDANINYQSIGSGGGIKQFTAKTVDFGASDAPLTQNETKALSSPAVHIPETIGSAVAAYNIPEVPNKGLKLTGPILADIFMGKVTKWDDPKIKELNSDLSLPSQNIVVAHRSDGSGTTYIWTSYLSLVSPEWNQMVGAGKSVQWPVGLAAPGNEGVANAVKSTPYSIGYVELAYALTTGMNYASLENKAGNFVEPSLNSTQAAAEAAVLNSSKATDANGTGAQNGTINLPSGEGYWGNVTLLDAPGADSYPIASFSYLLLYKDLSTNIHSMEKAKSLVEFVKWAVTEGQQFAPELSYVPLPDSVVQHNLKTLSSLTFNGQPVMQ